MNRAVARQWNRRAGFKAVPTRGPTPRQRSVNAIVKRAQISAAIGRGLNRRGTASKETGYVDLAAANYALDTTGSVTLIATIAQGASVNQRVGKKIILKSLQCRGYMQNNATALSNDVAYLIVYDKRPTGALPAVTDILVTASANSFNNDANSGRFRILKRVDNLLIGNVSQTAPPVSDGNMSDLYAVGEDWFLDLKGLPSVFKAAGTGAIGDIEEGALYLVTVGQRAAGTTAAAANLAFRTRFVDV